MSSIAEDLAAIKAALDAGPTPGPWHVVDGDHHFSRTDVEITSQHRIENSLSPIAEMDTDSAFAAEEIANADYIAACSPDRIARLVAHVERLEEFARYALSLKTGGMLERKAREALEDKE